MGVFILYSTIHSLYLVASIIIGVMALDFTNIKQRIEKPTTKVTSERGELLEKFVKRINQSRKNTGYRPYPVAYIAKLMAYIPTSELYAFYKKLEQSNNFVALWHWHVKPKPQSNANLFED